MGSEAAQRPGTGPRTVVATRYVTALREGGSLPGLIEADDDGLYVVKLRGAGQGTPVLVAELLAAGLARAAGLPMPEVVLVEVDSALGRNEPDPEIHALLLASVGLNLGLDFLPGSITFDPAASLAPSSELASRIVLFDAFITNPDRSAKNPNLLEWHDGGQRGKRGLWLIDHGAALYFQYGWRQEAPLAGARSAFSRLGGHVLLSRASGLAAAVGDLQAAWTPEVIAALCAAIPDTWLDGAHMTLPSREQYAAWLTARVEALPHLAEEAARARAHHV
ncbi:MAG: aminotransferase class I and II [Deltaproteobacteria bacterium]|jgi:hypothetical protein|nr:aminotransferase class I and II [Deltaproteobacteria bacterium]